MKKERLEREDTMFYQIHTTLLKQQQEIPSEDRAKIAKENIIAQIHSKLLKMLDQETLNKRVKVATEAIEIDQNIQENQITSILGEKFRRQRRAT